MRTKNDFFVIEPANTFALFMGRLERIARMPKYFFVSQNNYSKRYLHKNFICISMISIAVIN